MSAGQPSMIRTRWAAIGAAVAVCLGAGGFGLVSATVSSGERNVFVPITPCRVLDVRPSSQVGPKSSPLGPGETVTVGTHGSNGECNGIPADASAVSLNVTALDASELSFLTIWEHGVPRPNAASLNPALGAPPVPNAVTTEVAPTGEFDVYNASGSVNVVIDINGYFVDHDHDDRYAALDHDHDDAYAPYMAKQTRSMYDFEPVDAVSQWQRSVGFYLHFASTAAQCLFTQIDHVPGQELTGVSATYLALDPADLQVRLTGLKTAPGPNPGGVADLFHAVADSGSVAVEVGSGDGLQALDAAIVDPVLRDGYRYTLEICSEDELAIYGATVELT